MNNRIINNIFMAISGAVLVGFILISSVPALAQTAVDSSSSIGTSANWSGYAALGNTYTGVGGTWTIPVPDQNTSSGTAADATWVGIGGITSNDLIQAGTQAIVQGGQITYQAWYEALPNAQQIVPLTVKGDDSVTVSLNETSTNAWQISFTDSTTGQQYQTTVSYTSSHSSADWIEEMPRGIAGRAFEFTIPLDNFGSVQFMNGYAVVNGTTKTISALGAQELTMMGSGSQALATPSALGADGASFSVTRSNVSVSNPVTVYTQSGGRGLHRGRVLREFAQGRNGDGWFYVGRFGIPLGYFTRNMNTGEYSDR